ncbi:FAD-binding oxidoreductase [Salinisphaera sp. USBA-960]|nr:FAD-binding oxidoreductase [Salifodinibacter halophilus]NNC26236.1 FAD-binding oxidoreductase [Salifodinibacter halophilus]
MATLPEIRPEASIDANHAAFIERLTSDGFTGDIDTRYATRLTLATDNSPFQQLPAGVLFPRDEADIARAAQLLAKPAFADVCLTPRGGGTSTIGCSLTAGLVLDCSRYMNEIGTIDSEAGTVTVQPGVILDKLNNTVADHGVFFAPNVAPSSRATLGGMVNTDGCGRGSRVYGKTSDHVRAMRVVLADGTRCVITRDSAEVTSDTTDDQRLANIKQEVGKRVHDNAAEIERVFPDLSRYLSGYNLAQAVDADGRIDLIKLICGSEGTLALVTELTLDLTPKPDTHVLFALRYPDFDAALRDARTLVAYQPMAIETIDDVVMGLARDNPIYERVRAMIENTDGSTPAALNLVEFSGVGGLPDDVTAFAEALAAGQSTATGHYRAESVEARNALWDLRKSGVGLLGAAPGTRKPLPFVEDTVVDPQHLADYVADFRALLDSYGLSYGMFGHIDVGCLHVRPALDLTDPDDEAIMRAVTDRVAELAASYGGLLWNEHGKGFRSEYNRTVFGETLYAALAHIKRAFDPNSQLNPGKIVALDDARVPLASMDAPTRGTFDRQIPATERTTYKPALDCNGNGACFDYDTNHVMCPSYRATHDRLHSPKGRAGAMREWLRQLAKHDCHAADLPAARTPLVLRALVDAYRRSVAKPSHDFSHEVWTAMDGCLSCQGCSTQCPIKVDVPTFKADFLASYHGSYPRPPADYALAGMEAGAALAARMPKLSNRLLRNRSVRQMLSQSVGLVDPPPLSDPSLPRFLRAHPEWRFSEPDWVAMAPADRARAVFVVQDAFTSFFDAPVMRDTLQTIAALGYRPLVLPFRPAGKALQVKGFQPEFERVARRQAAFLASIADLGRPLVGIEPSITRMYAHEYGRLDDIDAPAIQPIERWLRQTLETEHTAHAAPADHGVPTHTLFQHCTIASSDTESARDWQRVFQSIGLSLATANVGCCGMSGAYGHEARHRDISQTVFEQSWAPAYNSVTSQPVVPGYSCRSQLKRFAAAEPLHPMQIIQHQFTPRPRDPNV